MTFEDAFREINGRSPTIEETKRALAIRRVVRDADLDPVLLFFLADANAAAERERTPATLKNAVDDGVKRLRAAIPAAGELAAAMGDVQAINTTFTRLNELLGAVSRWAIVGAAVSALAVLTIAVGCWRSGYGAGWSAQENVRWKTWNQSACESLAEVRHDLRTRAADVQALDRERTRRGC